MIGYNYAINSTFCQNNKWQISFIILKGGEKMGCDLQKIIIAMEIIREILTIAIITASSKA